MSIVALDVGGTTLRGARFGPEGLTDRIETVTPVIDGLRDPGSRAVRGLLQELLSVGPEPDAVGISFCEYVDGGAVTSRDVVDWQMQPQDWLATTHPAVPVRVESDVRCGALAESRWGALRGAAVGYFVSWGTGLSGCAVVDGTPVPGRRGRAIALGELPAGPGPSLEAFASGAGMASRYASRTGRQVAQAREVLAAVSGDPAAAEIAHSAGHALATALVSVVRLLDPEVIVLGGGLGVGVHPAGQALRDAWATQSELPPLLSAATGADSPLVGAATLAGWAGHPTGATAADRNRSASKR